MNNRQYYVYILFNKKNGTLYVGVTNNLIKRVWEHKNKVVEGFTQKYSVDKLEKKSRVQIFAPIFFINKYTWIIF